MKSINDKGVTAVEYGLISALISIVIMSSVQMIGVETKTVFCRVGNGLSVATGGNSSDCSGKAGVSTTPVSDKASMDALISATTDTFDTSYTPEAYGGSEKDMMDLTLEQNDITNPNSVTYALSSINAKDPIVDVFGLYDQNNNPITSYKDSYTAFSNMLESGDREGNQIGGPAPFVQVVTQSGKVYQVGVGNGVVTENSAK